MHLVVDNQQEGEDRCEVCQPWAGGYGATWSSEAPNYALRLDGMKRPNLIKGYDLYFSV